MAFPFPLRSPLLKKLVIGLAGLVFVLLLFLWLALPGIVQSRAEKFVAEKTGHRLSMARPQFNPFNLSLRLTKLQLVEPDEKPLLACDELLLDLSAASLSTRALVFDAIRLDSPEATVTELPGGTLNWKPFIDALLEPDDKPTGLPRLDIHSFTLTKGRLNFADLRSSPGFATRIEPLELSLSDLSTLPDDSGKFRIEARTSLGAQITLAGEVDLNPMMVAGTFSLQGLKLDQLAPYLKDVLPLPPAGTFQVVARYRAGNDGKSLDATVDQIEARLDGLRVPLDAGEGAGVTVGNLALRGGSFDLSKQMLRIGAIVLAETRLVLPRSEQPLELGRMTLEGAQVDLANRQATLAKVVMTEGKVHAVRNPDGKLPAVEALLALQASRKVMSSSAPKPVVKPWRFRLGKLEVADLGVFLRDESNSPASEFSFGKIALNVQGITENLEVPLPVKLSFVIGTGGRFDAEGTLTPASPEGLVADFKLKLADVMLKPAEPYLASRARLDIASGSLSTQGRASFDAAGPVYRGDVALRDLKLNEAGTDNTLLAWKNITTSELTVTSQRLDLDELRLHGLYTRLIIAKDKSLNLQKIIKPAPVAAEPLPAAGKTAAFVINVDRLRFYNGEMDFADHSLVLPFGTHIHKLRGSVIHLTTQPGGPPGQIELEGEVDEYGMARAVGQVNLFDPTGFTDLRVNFKNVEMTRLTPYLATFAGRKIDSGKLNLDLQYKLKQRQLQGENQLVIDRLKLGERVESPSAKELPLDLAITILKDSDGRIDLGVPVSGSLDDPEFSYGAIVWKAIANALTKIVTAPFRTLASLLGGSEKAESIVFEAGAEKLIPPEREKLVRLAKGVAKRPGLVLAVGGTYADVDRAALQEVQLRRGVMSQMGQRVPAETWDPGPLSTSQPAVREALEKLYDERFGASDLAALKEGFRKANPGQLEESAAGKMLSRLSGMLREKKMLSDDEVAGLQGADFHAVLYEKLRAKEVVDEDRLRTLGQARTESALGVLRASGLTPERLRSLPPERGQGAEGLVPLKLAVEAVRKD